MRVFRINFEKMFVTVQCNKLIIVNGKSFRVLDTILTHNKPIKAVDISLLTKDIVSIDSNTMVVHRLKRDSGDH